MTQCQSGSAEDQSRSDGGRSRPGRWARRGSRPLPLAWSLCGDLMWHCLISPCFFELTRMSARGVEVWDEQRGIGELREVAIKVW